MTLAPRVLFSVLYIPLSCYLGSLSPYFDKHSTFQQISSHPWPSDVLGKDSILRIVSFSDLANTFVLCSLSVIPSGVLLFFVPATSLVFFKMVYTVLFLSGIA